MKRRRKRTHIPTSPRFPNLSSAMWWELRRTGEARDIWRWYHERLAPVGAFANLSITMQVECVALVARLHKGFRDYVGDRYVRREMKKVSREARRRYRMLRSKISDAVAALDDLADYVASIEGELSGDYFRGVFRPPAPDLADCLPVPSCEEIRIDADRYRSVRPATAEEVVDEVAAITGGNKLARPLPTVRSEVSVALMEWFNGQLHSNREAEIRTAQIMNTLFGDEIKVKQHGEPTQHRGAETMRSRRRRSRSQST